MYIVSSRSLLSSFFKVTLREILYGGSKDNWWELVDFWGARYFGAYSMGLTREGDSYGCQIRRQLNAREITGRWNSFKSVLCSVALGNFEIFSCLINKCLLVVIPSI